MSQFDLVAFDADDTLWHNEVIYIAAQKKFAQLLSQYHDPKWIQERLDATEARNLGHFGYGIKSFALSMIETAVELTEGRITGQDIQTLLDLTKEMLATQVELMPDISTTIEELSRSYTLMVITKGDLFDQETKLARSGLLPHFQHVEIVSNKNAETYSRLLKRYNTPPHRFVMVGNALRSDILPVLEIGGNAIYVPYDATWLHESGDPPPPDTKRFYQVANVNLVPGLLSKIESEGIT
jgi:putative hydrolase of the HAD superfamily